MAASIVVSLLLGAHSLAAGELAGEAAPDFALKSVEGSNLRLSEYRGEVVLLTLWASWCGDCRDQLEGLQSMHTRLGAQGLSILSVAIDSDSKRGREMIRSLSLNFPILLDDDKTVARLYDPRFMPMTVLIDPEGTVRHVHQGFDKADAALYAAEVEQLLADYGPFAEEG